MIDIISQVILHDGAWAALSLFLVLALIREGRANRDAMIRTAEVLMALKIHIETAFRVSEDSK